MEEIIRKARESDIPKLREIWAECFPQDVEYAKFFFERIFKLPCAVVCEIAGECVGMIHVFPRELSTPKGKLSGKYIYGVGTLKKFRGRGIAGRLLASEEHSCDALLLIPQSESLFEFYRKYGFSETAYVDSFSVMPGGKAEIYEAGEKDIPHLNRVYEESLAGAVFASRDSETWKLLIDEYKSFGGGFAVWSGGYCAYYEEGGRVILPEFFGDREKASEIAGAFSKECVVTTRGKGRPIAVIKPISEKAKEVLCDDCERYINLMHN